VIFPLTNLQVAATYVLRRRLTGAEALTPLLLATDLWLLVVPVQVFGPVWIGGFGYLPLADLVVLAVLLLPIDWTVRRPALAQ
jgi:hypothetical protein